MRIGFFSDSYRPYVSGVVRSIDTFREELRKRGHEVFIFAPDYPDARPEPGVFRYLSVNTPTDTGFRVAIPLSLQLRRLVKELGLDVIHLHSPFLMGRLGAHVARRQGLPLILTHHTLYDQYVHYVPLLGVAGWTQGLTRQWTNHYVRDFCNLCDAVIVPSQGVGELLRQRGVRQAPIIIPTGIHPERFRGGDRWGMRARLGIPGEAPLVLYVGRLGWEKNLPYLLQAFHRVAAVAEPAHLLLAGGGPMEEELRRLAGELGLADRVHLPGMLSLSDLRDAYAAADVFAFASETETQGLVVAEAMAAGLPVVALAATGIVDVVQGGRSGILVSGGPEEFAGALLQVIGDAALRRRLSQGARRRAAEFSAAAMTDRLVALYEEQIRGEHRGLAEHEVPALFRLAPMAALGRIRHRRSRRLIR